MDSKIPRKAGRPLGSKDKKPRQMNKLTKFERYILEIYPQLVNENKRLLNSNFELSEIISASLAKQDRINDKILKSMKSQDEINEMILNSVKTITSYMDKKEND